jgi:MFS family permease
MYVAAARSGSAPPRARSLRGVPGAVVLLGGVSLLTDISAEMITAFLPIYLVYSLQLSYLQVGFLDGLYTGATALLRLVGGYLADRIGRHKGVAVAGYSLSAATKLAFPLAGPSAVALGGVLATDRAGKGLRTGPRDAMISLVTAPGKLGAAFGVHRSMDTFGAMLGPLVTFGMLVWLGSKPQPIFMVSFLFALLGVIVLVFFVREPRRVADRGQTAPKVSPRRVAALLTDRAVRRTAIAAAFLGLATISDVFVFLVLQQVAHVPPNVLPLMPLGTALVFLAAAAPMGHLGDRIGRWTVFFAGHVLLLGVYLMLLGPFAGLLLVGLTLTLHGLFYAATDGVLSAHAAALLPPELRASGLSVVQTGQAVARFGSSVVFGKLLQQVLFSTAVLFAVGALTAALLAVTALMRPAQRTVTPSKVARSGDLVKSGPLKRGPER